MKNDLDIRNTCQGCYWEGNCSGAIDGCEHYHPLNIEEYEINAYEQEVHSCIDDYYAWAEEDFS